MEQDCPVDKGEAVAGPPQDAAVLQRQEQLRKTMELLEHASVCKDPNCKNENCKRVRMLLRHGLECQVKYQGGCQLCRRMWALLQIHAKSCQKDNCPVPRCQDLRAHKSQWAGQTRQNSTVGAAMTPPLGETAGVSCPPVTAKGGKKRLEIKKWSAVALWGWDVDVDNCAICRNHIMELCIECQATEQEITDELRAECTSATGVCNHAFHMHCISRWLKTRQVCPLCNVEWEFLKYGH